MKQVQALASSYVCVTFGKLISLNQAVRKSATRLPLKDAVIGKLNTASWALHERTILEEIVKNIKYKEDNRFEVVIKKLKVTPPTPITQPKAPRISILANIEIKEFKDDIACKTRIQKHRSSKIIDITQN